MRCPKCQSLDDFVNNSRPKKDFTMITRRRGCADCGHRWTTYEQESVKIITTNHINKIEYIEQTLLELKKLMGM